MTPAKNNNRMLFNSLIILGITSVIGLATWAYADLRGRADTQTEAITALKLVVSNAMAQETAPATLEEKAAIKKAAHFHEHGTAGVTLCFPEVR